MTKTFRESGLIFTFPENWTVVKLDEHRFYSYVSGRGYKGVDFIAIDGTGRLILLEVKNYRDRYPKDGVRPVAALLESPSLYAHNYLRKFEDSFSLIRIVHQYYQRKFWVRRVGEPFLRFGFHPWLLRFDWVFWWKVYQNRMAGSKHTRLVLWLELDEGVLSEQLASLRHHLIHRFDEHFEKENERIELITDPMIDNNLQIEVRHGP